MILFAVNSAFQMITAVQLRLTEFKNEFADIIITDEFAHQEKIAEGVIKSGIFSNVYCVKVKDYHWKNWKFVLCGGIFDRELTKRLPHIKDRCYDTFLFCNYAGFTTCLAAYLRKRNHAELMMFEDGFASYSESWKSRIIDAIQPTSTTEKILYSLRKKSLYYVTKYWVFNPKLIGDWKIKFSIEKIEKFHADTIDALNKIYQYNQSVDDYRGVKCIFFEESYFADGIDVPDLDIVEMISNIVGKENVMIKIHPRNPYNRFQKLGYKTNQNTEIPWEIIALNHDFSNTVLITIASGSSITSHFVSDTSALKSMLLYDMKEMDRSKLTPTLEVFEKICKSDDYFIFPSDFEDLKRIIHRMVEEIK